MQRLLELSYNYVLFVAVLSWCSAQVIKTIIHLVKNKKFSVERLTGAGGMPSGHSAMVCSLTIAMSRTAGAASPEFALAFILALVVMYDAMGVRRAAGQHAKEINKMRRQIDELEELEDLDEADENEEPKALKEYLGHTPLEVLAGALLGILIAMIVPVPMG